jgi:hypothetical protein
MTWLLWLAFAIFNAGLTSFQISSGNIGFAFFSAAVALWAIGMSLICFFFHLRQYYTPAIPGPQGIPGPPGPVGATGTCFCKCV